MKTKSKSCKEKKKTLGHKYVKTCNSNFLPTKETA